MRRLIAGTLVFLTSMVVAYADTITIKGKQYSNVLVYESGSYYYVKLPREGKSLSVRKSDVPSDQVSTTDDPYYREQLRELFDDVKLRGEAALLDARPINSAFVDAPKESGGGGDALGLLSGGGGKPMNLSVAEAQELFKRSQVNLTKSGNAYVGKTPDGILSIRMTEKDGQVTTIAGSVTTTDQAQIQGKMMAVVGIAGRVAPWTTQWVTGNMQTLMTGGSITHTQDGVQVSIQISVTGLTFAIRGA